MDFSGGLLEGLSGFWEGFSFSIFLECFGVVRFLLKILDFFGSI